MVRFVSASNLGKMRQLQLGNGYLCLYRVQHLWSRRMFFVVKSLSDPNLNFPQLCMQLFALLEVVLAAFSASRVCAYPYLTATFSFSGEKSWSKLVLRKQLYMQI